MSLVIQSVQTLIGSRGFQYSSVCKLQLPLIKHIVIRLQTKGLFWPDRRSEGTVSLSVIGCLCLASSLAELISSRDQTVRRDTGRSVTPSQQLLRNDSDRLQGSRSRSHAILLQATFHSELRICVGSRERAFYFLLLKAFLWILSGLKQSCSNSQGPAPHSSLRNIPVQTQEICKIFNEFLFWVVHSISSSGQGCAVLDILAKYLIGSDVSLAIIHGAKIFVIWCYGYLWPG